MSSSVVPGLAFGKISYKDKENGDGGNFSDTTRDVE